MYSAARPGIIWIGSIDLEIVSNQLKIISETKLVIHIQEIKNPDSQHHY